MVTPLFANLSSLIGLKRAHGIDVDPTLLRVLTDLYVREPAHPEGEAREYAAMILPLIERVDDDTRAVVAAKLRAYGDLDPAIAERLADIPPAEPAAAPSIAAPIEAAVAADPDFLAASPQQRRRILAALERADTAVAAAPLDAPAAVRALDIAALSGRPGDFIREIERSLQLPRAVAQRIVNDAGGEPTVVVAKALGMPVEVLQRILLFVNPAVGHSVRRVFDLSALYDAFSRDAALRLVALWREAERPQPRVAPSAMRQPGPSAREAATPAAHPAPAVPDIKQRQRTT